jgi:hypothetical protein
MKTSPIRPALAIASLVLAGAPALRAQEIRRVSAPAIGQAFTIDYASTANNVFGMSAAANSNGSLTVPGIGNTLRLDLASLFPLYGGVVPGSGMHVQSIPIPNNQAFVGGCLSIQSVDFGAPSTYNFSKNAVDFCASNGIGTILLAEGSNSTMTLGDLDFESVNNATAGAPVTVGLGKVAPQSIQYMGMEGWMPLVQPTAFGLQQADQHVDTGKSVARDGRESVTQNIKCPNGFDLYVCRSLANQKEFFLMSVERRTSIAKELSGSRVTDSGTTAQPPSDYRAYFTFTLDGEVAVALVHDSTNGIPNAGPPDRVHLIYTNPARSWSNGKNVIDVSPASGPNKLHTSAFAAARIGNGWGFVEGQIGSGEWGLWAGKLDGSPWSRFSLPQTGTMRNNTVTYNGWRQTPDGSAGIYNIGGDFTNTAHMDCVAITNIGPTTTPTVTNITKFATSTQIQNPGPNGLLGQGNLAAISPDGKNVAIIIGPNNATAASGIAIVPTDGSKAGSVTAFTTGEFDPQVVRFGELHWLSNTALLFAAGSSSTSGLALDYYVRDLSGTPKTLALTKTTTGSTVVPFTQGGDTGSIHVITSVFSDNRRYYYFVRRFTSTAAALHRNIVGIDARTFALIDITGSEFSGGTSPNVRQDGNLLWQWRRHPTTNHLFFVAGKTGASATNYNDDNIWRFDAENAGAAVQVTANDGNGLLTDIQRIDDLTLDPLGIYVAWTQGKGLATADPENLFLQVWVAGTPIQISKSPPSATEQGIRSGSIHFSPPPTPGICWVQGTGSRSFPSANAVALWSMLLPDKAPLRLSGAPVPATRHILPLGCGQ